MKETFLECGKIINTHGFRGTVKLESFCDTPKVLAGLKRVFFKDGKDFSERKVLSASVFKTFVLMTLEGISTEQSAKASVGQTVYAHREDLPLGKNSHFVADLIGLDVKDADSGKLLGTVAGIQSSVASDLFEIRTDHGNFLVPGVAQFIVRTDPDDAIYIRPIPGLLDADGEDVK